jgi:hypothetical protein
MSTPGSQTPMVLCHVEFEVWSSSFSLLGLHNDNLKVELRTPIIFSVTEYKRKTGQD